MGLIKEEPACWLSSPRDKVLELGWRLGLLGAPLELTSLSLLLFLEGMAEVEEEEVGRTGDSTCS